MRFFSRLAVLLASISAFPIGAAGATIELIATQGIQDSANSLPLFAGRAVVVRARIVTGGTSLSGVGADLLVTLQATGATPVNLQPLPKITGFTAPANPDLSRETDTLNFEVKDPAFLAAQAGTTVKFQVTTTNPSLTAVLPPKVLQSWRTPIFYYTRIYYLPPGGVSVLPPPSFRVLPGVGDAMMRGALPLKDGIPNPYREAFPPAFRFQIDLDGDGSINDFPYPPNNEDDECRLRYSLEALRQLQVIFNLGATADTYMFGWTEAATIGGSNGFSSCVGNVGFGEVNLSKYQRTYLHELCHQFGIGPHTFSALNPNTGWDAGGRLLLNPPQNKVSGKVKSKSLLGIMTPGIDTFLAWMDSTVYQQIITGTVVDCPSGTATADADLDELSAFVVWVRGFLSHDGTQLEDLRPAFRFPWLSQPSRQSSGALYKVEITDENGGIVTRPFDAIVSGDTATHRGFFSVMVPLSGRADVLRILDQNNNQLGGMERTLVAPAITITSPAANETLDGENELVSWDPFDPDTPEEILYQVAFSWDEGSSFVPVEVDISTTSFTFDANLLPAAPDGKGIIKICGSDGLNTTCVDVTGLTTPGPSVKFLRGDVDANGAVNITDVLPIFMYLFGGDDTLPCRAAADTSLSGTIDLSSAVYLLCHLFKGGPPLAAPYPACGRSQAPSDLAFGCDVSPPGCP